jgi:hypothetical protein
MNGYDTLPKLGFRCAATLEDIAIKNNTLDGANWIAKTLNASSAAIIAFIKTSLLTIARYCEQVQ